MKYKWQVISAIIVAIISGLGSAYVANATSENALKLAQLEFKSKELKEQREHFNRRCGAISSLHKEMSENMQTLYENGSSENIEPTLNKLAMLRSKTQLAKSYFGERANEIYSIAKKEIEADKNSFPEGYIAAYLVGLGEELKLCNGYNSFPTEK